MSQALQDLPFDNIAQYVGAHESFTRLPESHKLIFYGLYKTSKSLAPDFGFPRRLYLFICAQSEYQKWLAWWSASQKYSKDEAIQQYCQAAADIAAFPPPNMIDMMRSASRGKGLSQLSQTDNDEPMDNDMDILIDACRSGKVDVIQDYLAHGGNVNIKNEEETTLLHFAVDADALEIVQLLLQYGVDVHAKDDQGTSALDSAEMNDFLAIASLLKSNGASAT